jgi:hypothetical protein
VAITLATPEQLASYMQQSLDNLPTVQLHLETASGRIIKAARYDFQDLTEVPPEIVGLTLRLAAELFSAPGGTAAVSEQIDDYRVQYALPVGGRVPGDLTDAERRRLREGYGPLPVHRSAHLRAHA